MHNLFGNGYSFKCMHILISSFIRVKFKETNMTLMKYYYFAYILVHWDGNRRR